jgi:hypothetical protein
MTVRNIRFKYRERYRPYGIDASRRPYIGVRLGANGRTTEVIALADSGADGSRFPLSVGLDLGFDFADDPGELSYGFGGPSLVYRRVVTMTFARRSFEAEVRFDAGAKEWQAVLGRRDFFTRFFVGFDENELAVFFDPL